MKKRMRLDAEEDELLASVEGGEWKAVGGGNRERARHARYARATLGKDRQLNIRLSSKDLERRGTGVKRTTVGRALMAIDGHDS